MKSLDLIEKTLKKSQEFIRSKTSKTSFVKLFEYGNILLKTYVEIATSGDLKGLIVSGSPTQDELVERWEQIIQDNGKHNGDFHYDTYFQLLQGYSQLLAQHTIINCHLLKMTFVIDWESIEAVRAEGYKINTSTSESYADSLSNAKRKASNLITRYEMKRKEIERIYGGKAETKAVGIEEILGNLEFLMDSPGSLDAEKITLAKYNTLKKLYQEKNKKK